MNPFLFGIGVSIVYEGPSALVESIGVLAALTSTFFHRAAPETVVFGSSEEPIVSLNEAGLFSSLF